MNAYDATLANGGATVDARSLVAIVPLGGYAVGLHDGTALVVPMTRFDVERAVRAVARTYTSRYVGTWVHDGKVHVDPVAIVGNRKDAERLGRRNRQLAIWSFATQEEIAL
jgi:hypothetical protein